MSEEEISTPKFSDDSANEWDVASEAASQEITEDSASSEVEKLRSELAEAKDQYIRLMADFENYKKRAMKERSELLKYQGEKIFVDLLDVKDSFEFALQYKDADPENVRNGLEMIRKSFDAFLSKWEVSPLDGLGKPFDPNQYAAISKAPPSEDCPIGTIVNEFKKAYLYKDRLIRIGEVVVAGD